MGERLAADIGAVLGGLLLAGLFLFIVLLGRRWLLERGGGTVECSLRTISGGRPAAWRLGIARYSRDELCWFRVFGLRLRPWHVMERRSLVILERRGPADDEIAVLSQDAGVVTLQDGDNMFEISMSSGALVGFLAWLEAAPPGFPVNRF